MGGGGKTSATEVKLGAWSMGVANYSHSSGVNAPERNPAK